MKILIYNILICHFDKYSNPNAINSITVLSSFLIYLFVLSGYETSTNHIFSLTKCKSYAPFSKGQYSDSGRIPRGIILFLNTKIYI